MASTAPDGSVCAARNRPSSAEQVVVAVVARGLAALDQARHQQAVAPVAVRPWSLSAAQSSRSTSRSSAQANPRSAVSSAPGMPAPAAWYRPMIPPAWRTTL